MELNIERLNKKYGKQEALINFSASLTEGVYGIIGPNGAGKTTLLSIIIGILKQNSGNIFFDGVDIEDMGVYYLDKIGYMPQYPVFYKNFTLIEFLGYICALKAVPKSKTRQKIEEVLSFVNLLDARRKKIGALSGGMRQRLGIAQAILNDPKILILDEPTAGLDPLERIRFRNIISKISGSRLILYSTHIVSDVEYIAKEILILKKGSLVKQGTPEFLIENMAATVWEVDVEESKIEWYTSNFLVINIKRGNDGYILRIISEEKPAPNAVQVNPILEDVFLHVFGSNEIKEKDFGTANLF